MPYCLLRATFVCLPAVAPYVATPYRSRYHQASSTYVLFHETANTKNVSRRWSTGKSASPNLEENCLEYAGRYTGKIASEAT